MKKYKFLPRSRELFPFPFTPALEHIPVHEDQVSKVPRDQAGKICNYIVNSTDAQRQMQKSPYVHVNQKGLSSCMPQTGTDVTACSLRKKVKTCDSSCTGISNLPAFLPKSPVSHNQHSGKSQKAANWSCDVLWAQEQ